MGYTAAGTTDVDSVVPEEWGGMYFFRDALDCEQLGVSLLELEPEGKGKRHDHSGTVHEEVYLVVDGELTVELSDDAGDESSGKGDDKTESEAGGERVTLTNGEAVRVDPETTRQLFNRGDEPVRVVIAGAP